MRMQLIKLGAFLSPVGRSTWDHENNRDEEFQIWFETDMDSAFARRAFETTPRTTLCLGYWRQRMRLDNHLLL